MDNKNASECHGKKTRSQEILDKLGIVVKPVNTFEEVFAAEGPVVLISKPKPNKDYWKIK